MDIKVWFGGNISVCKLNNLLIVSKKTSLKTLQMVGIPTV
jgi:hypothetical protein